MVILISGNKKCEFLREVLTESDLSKYRELVQPPIKIRRLYCLDNLIINILCWLSFPFRPDIHLESEKGMSNV